MDNYHQMISKIFDDRCKQTREMNKKINTQNISLWYNIVSYGGK